MASMIDEIFKQSITGAPPDAREEMLEVAEEIWGHGRLERLMIAALVYFYTEEEIIHLAKWLASPVGQSLLEKMRQCNLAMMQYGQAEALRAFLRRHPELADQDTPVLDDQQLADAFPWLPPDHPKALAEPAGN